MANPIGNPQNREPMAPRELYEVRPLPAGVGDAPDIIQLAQGQQHEGKPSCIQTVVFFVRDWVVWILKKVFPCWFKETEPQLSRERRAEIRLLANRIRDQIQNGQIQIDANPQRFNFYQGMNIINLAYSNLPDLVRENDAFSEEEIQVFFDMYEALRDRFDMLNHGLYQENYLFLCGVFERRG